MRRATITLARAIGYIEAIDLSPEGGVFFPDLVKAIAKEYQFQKFPQTVAEHDTRSKAGVEFLQGRSSEGRVIERFVIWSGVLVLETRSGTKDSQQLMEEMLLWAAENFGIKYGPGTITRYAYISSVTFYSDAPLLTVSPAIERLTKTTNEALAEIWQEPIRYEPITISIGHDPTTRKFGIASFQISRRADIRFADNKYFSEAPLPTELHWEMLEQFERDILMAGKATIV